MQAKRDEDVAIRHARTRAIRIEYCMNRRLQVESYLELESCQASKIKYGEIA